MKINTVWTDGEGTNVLYALRKKFGNLAPRTLVKYAVRAYVEQARLERLKGRYDGQ